MLCAPVFFRFNGNGKFSQVIEKQGAKTRRSENFEGFVPTHEKTVYNGHFPLGYIICHFR